MSELSIGDPVEVEKLYFTENGLEPSWVPATVVYVKAESIGVAYADGNRHVIENGRGLWRRVPEQADPLVEADKP